MYVNQRTYSPNADRNPRPRRIPEIPEAKTGPAIRQKIRSATRRLAVLPLRRLQRPHGPRREHHRRTQRPSRRRLPRRNAGQQEKGEVMKENRARIAVILDRSGSMSSVRESTVSGFNEFIRSQRALPGDVSVKLVQFDDQYEVVFDKRLADVPELTQDLFVPRGRTALFDAQGRTIVALGEELAALAESERPSKVIGMTLTDGLENASQHFTVEIISALIKQQIEVYKWDFVFLGASQVAIRTAAT